MVPIPFPPFLLFLITAFFGSAKNIMFWGRKSGKFPFLTSFFLFFFFRQESLRESGQFQEGEETDKMIFALCSFLLFVFLILFLYDSFIICHSQTLSFSIVEKSAVDRSRKQFRHLCFFIEGRKKRDTIPRSWIHTICFRRWWSVPFSSFFRFFFVAWRCKFWIFKNFQRCFVCLFFFKKICVSFLFFFFGSFLHPFQRCGFCVFFQFVLCPFYYCTLPFLFWLASMILVGGPLKESSRGRASGHFANSIWKMVLFRPLPLKR